MNITELKQGQIYYSSKIGRYFKLKPSGVLLISDTNDKYDWNYCTISHNELMSYYDFETVKCLREVNWRKIQINTKILVRESEDEDFTNAYFSRYENGYVFAFCDGRTDWTANGKDDYWNEAKLFDTNNDYVYK